MSPAWCREHKHLSIPTTITPSPPLPSRTQRNHGQCSAWGWKPIAVQWTVAMTGNHRVALVSLSLIQGTRSMAAQDSKELILHQRTKAQNFIDGSHQTPKNLHQLPQHWVWDNCPSRQAGTCTSPLMLLPSKTFLWPRNIIATLHKGSTAT